MDFGKAVRFPFRGQYAWMNLLFILVSMLIPIVGAMVAVGYGVLVEKTVIQDPDAEAPRFDFGQFAEHLKRGVAPFVVALIVMLSALIPTVILYIGGVLAVLATKPEPWVIVLLVLGGIGAQMMLMLTFSVLGWPMIIRAALEGKIGRALNLRFMVGFHRRVWREEAKIVGMQLLIMIPLMMIACIPFAMWVLMPVITVVSWHLQGQLYRAYVDAGGEPLVFEPVKVVPAPAFPVVQGPATTNVQG